ncbi:hypothetical protein HPB52_000922 [Rhipicephalus sanguineus]|uniref:Uncharacterized protein n=1 Tax=Rhipicephalus sanguineus TaxID=34632 RepID=A0A9D4PUT3_RHISA|nr:hypothetical protein HPB52_000922 [Rhipicephalus sanguineus]
MAAPVIEMAGDCDEELEKVRATQLSVEQKVCALRFFATESFQGSVGIEEMIHMAQSAMRILAIDPMRPGSDHDSFIWQTTWLRLRVLARHIAEPGKYLLGDADTHIGRCLVHYLKESARRELTDISEEDWVRWKRAARGDEPTGAFATIAWIPGTRDELRNMAISDAMEARDVNVVLGMLLTVVRPIPEKCIPTLLFADS